MSTTTKPQTPGGPKAAAVADYLDQRTAVGKLVKELARKIFPDHWSFMIGEIAMFSFITLVLTGVFLALYFDPSMAEVHYPDDALPVTMQGVQMSAAFASVLDISFHVTGGLLMRQIHHWAALLFMAAAVAHLFRIFFTGAFRKPREINYLIGFTMLLLGLAAGLTGYSLPDDVLSGNGLRITDGVVRAVPIIGTWTSLAIFGGEFPGTVIIGRFFAAHILLIPGLIIALLSAHMIIMVFQKHTQFPGPGKTDRNVVGYPAFPVYVAKMGGNFFIVSGVLALMGGLLSINPVWNYGPYDPSPVSAGAQPDWYMLFLDGALRLMPGFAEVEFLGFTLSLNILIPAMVIPGILFTFLGAYPFIEAAVTKDRAEHHVLDRPRNAPVRTALGVAALAAFILLGAAGALDLIATHLHLDVFHVVWAFRIGIFVLPVIAFMLTKRICLALQRRDRELVLHGHETGRVVQLENGEFKEVHRPLTPNERWTLVSFHNHKPLEIEPAEDAHGVVRPGYKKDLRMQRLSRFFYEDRIEPVTPAELAAAHEQHAAVASGDQQRQLEPSKH